MYKTFFIYFKYLIKLWSELGWKSEFEKKHKVDLKLKHLWTCLTDLSQINPWYPIFYFYFLFLYTCSIFDPCLKNHLWTFLTGSLYCMWYTAGFDSGFSTLILFTNSSLAPLQACTAFQLTSEVDAITLHSVESKTYIFIKITSAWERGKTRRVHSSF